MWGPGKRPFIKLANARVPSQCTTQGRVFTYLDMDFKVLQGSNQEKVGFVFEERETASHVTNHELLVNPDI